MLLGERSQSGKDYPHFRKGKTGPVKSGSGGGGEKEQVRHRAFVMQWNYFVVL